MAFWNESGNGAPEDLEDILNEDDSDCSVNDNIEVEYIEETSDAEGLMTGDESQELSLMETEYEADESRSSAPSPSLVAYYNEESEVISLSRMSSPPREMSLTDTGSTSANKRVKVRRSTRGKQEAPSPPASTSKPVPARYVDLPVPRTNLLKANDVSESPKEKSSRRQRTSKKRSSPPREMSLTDTGSTSANKVKPRDGSGHRPKRSQQGDEVDEVFNYEILDHSLGELKCSLQINFMVEIGWLLAQYYFAGYSEKKLTILYGEDCSEDLKNINKKKPQVDAHYVTMSTPFGKHHTKMMILCYEDGSLRVVISTANLYLDDWENRTQGLWFSPSCPELPADAMPHDGDSPTMFKKSLLRYLNHYHLPQLAYYVERVKRCDFSHINVFLVASVPGSHFDQDWGMTRVGSLLRQHCCIPTEETRQWPLIAQASSIGSYGKEPKLWLTGDFLHNFTKIKNQSQLLSSPPELKIVYPSLENVRQSHDNLLGGGCLPYAADAHAKQPWLNAFLYQWQAHSSHRNRAMPHIKSYTRFSNNKAAYYLLTSANVSKAAWGQLNKGNGALRIMSYEAGVLFLPQFVIKEDFFPLQQNAKNRLIIPYDLPPVKYTPEMSPWVSDYLR